jgi:hypothetical protein
MISDCQDWNHWIFNSSHSISNQQSRNQQLSGGKWKNCPGYEPNLQSEICNLKLFYCFISEQHGFCTGLGSISSTRV